MKAFFPLPPMPMRNEIVGAPNALLDADAENVVDKKDEIQNQPVVNH